MLASPLQDSISLTSREEEILTLIAFEKTTQEIAEKLFISPHTAISHRKNLMLKLGVRNAAGLVRRAFELSLLHIKLDRANAQTTANIL